MEAVTLIELVKMYLLLDISFLLTSFFTLHIPAWRIAMMWAKENLDEESHPNKLYVFSHTVAYTLVALIAFPFLVAMLLLGNQQALTSYTGTIIKGMIEDDAEE